MPQDIESRLTRLENLYDELNKTNQNIQVSLGDITKTLLEIKLIVSITKKPCWFKRMLG